MEEGSRLRSALGRFVWRLVAIDAALFLLAGAGAYLFGARTWNGYGVALEQVTVVLLIAALFAGIGGLDMRGRDFGDLSMSRNWNLFMSRPFQERLDGLGCFGLLLVAGVLPAVLSVLLQLRFPSE